MVYKMKTGVELITEERQRQIDVEGWSAEHDDKNNNDVSLSGAAAAYLTNDIDFWPWDEEWYKPTSRVRDLVKAGALIAAEIDRLNRLKL